MKNKLAMLTLLLGLLYVNNYAQIGINKTVVYSALSKDFPQKNNGSYYMNSIRYLLYGGDTLKSINKGLYYQMLCTQYSFVGAYKQSELYFNTVLRNPENYDDELRLPDSYDTLNIYSYLNELHDSVKYIFFNEDHFRPQSRITVLNSLSILYKKGFKYLFCETLNNKDSLINIRKYTVVESGSYTSDPVYGNLLREALRIGYTILPYEDTNRTPFESNGKLFTKGDRETEQANNLLNFVSTHNNSKFIVLAGFDHINEGKKFGWMASIFKLKSGFDPLTIEQTDMQEYSDGGFSNNFFKLFRNKYQNKLPVLLINNNKMPYSLNPNKFDITLIPARTDYINERPDWLINLDGNIEYKINMNTWKIKDTCLIQALNTNEDINISIPVDQILIENINLKYSLYLKKGDYLIRKFNKSGIIEKSLYVNIVSLQMEMDN